MMAGASGERVSKSIMTADHPSRPLATASANGWTGRLPCDRSSQPATVKVQRESKMSSTSSTGPGGGGLVDVELGVTFELLEAVLHFLLRRRLRGRHDRRPNGMPSARPARANASTRFGPAKSKAPPSPIRRRVGRHRWRISRAEAVTSSSANAPHGTSPLHISAPAGIAVEAQRHRPSSGANLRRDVHRPAGRRGGHCRRGSIVRGPPQELDGLGRARSRRSRETTSPAQFAHRPHGAARGRPGVARTNSMRQPVWSTKAASVELESPRRGHPFDALHVRLPGVKVRRYFDPRRATAPSISSSLSAFAIRPKGRLTDFWRSGPMTPSTLRPPPVPAA